MSPEVPALSTARMMVIGHIAMRLMIGRGGACATRSPAPMMMIDMMIDRWRMMIHMVAAATPPGQTTRSKMVVIMVAWLLMIIMVVAGWMVVMLVVVVARVMTVMVARAANMVARAANMVAMDAARTGSEAILGCHVVGVAHGQFLALVACQFDGSTDFRCDGAFESALAKKGVDRLNTVPTCAKKKLY